MFLQECHVRKIRIRILLECLRVDPVNELFCMIQIRGSKEELHFVCIIRVLPQVLKIQSSRACCGASCARTCLMTSIFTPLSLASM